MLEICNLRMLIIRCSGQYKIETCGSITKLTFGCILISWYLTDVMKTIAVNYKYTVNSCGLIVYRYCVHNFRVQRNTKDTILSTCHSRVEKLTC